MKQKMVYIEQNKAYDLGNNVTYIPTAEQLREARLFTFASEFNISQNDAKQIIDVFKLWEQIDTTLQNNLTDYLRYQHKRVMCDGSTCKL